MKAIILAAGIGSRLGKPHPKPLTELITGETILGRQVRTLSKYMGRDNIMVVVGFKKDLIMEAYPDLVFIYNNMYDRTNTSKSLLSALQKINDEDVIWLNGDVVFEEKTLEKIIQSNTTCMAVNTQSVGEEEVKYNINDKGTIRQVSKSIKDGLGEAVGINKVLNSDLNLFVEMLHSCQDEDYFERGLEFSIEKGMEIHPVDITSHLCMEIDSIEDLDQINNKL